MQWLRYRIYKLKDHKCNGSVYGNYIYNLAPFQLLPEPFNPVAFMSHEDQEIRYVKLCYPDRKVKWGRLLPKNRNPRI
jgi:hypothetical protein